MLTRKVVLNGKRSNSLFGISIKPPLENFNFSNRNYLYNLFYAAKYHVYFVF